jgi:hypothetical protein
MKNKLWIILGLTIAVSLIILTNSIGLFAADTGIIRVKFQPFPYYPDPNGISYNSFGKLGDLSAYVLRIYTDSEMQQFIKTAKSSEKWFGAGKIDGVTYGPDSSTYGDIAVGTAKALMESPRRESTLNFFNKGGRIEIYVFTDRLPPYIDIPAPIGMYYIEYSLLFLDAKNPKHSKVHPNYPHQSRLDSSTLWGPPKVQVRPGLIAHIDFRPMHNINFYQYPHPKKGYFENSEGFWDWIKFLLWAGEIQK